MQDKIKVKINTLTMIKVKSGKRDAAGKKVGFPDWLDKKVLKNRLLKFSERFFHIFPTKKECNSKFVSIWDGDEGMERTLLPAQV